MSCWVSSVSLAQAWLISSWIRASSVERSIQWSMKTLHSTKRLELPMRSSRKMETQLLSLPTRLTRTRLLAGSVAASLQCLVRLLLHLLLLMVKARLVLDTCLRTTIPARRCHHLTSPRLQAMFPCLPPGRWQGLALHRLVCTMREVPRTPRPHPPIHQLHPHTARPVLPIRPLLQLTHQPPLPIHLHHQHTVPPVLLTRPPRRPIAPQVLHTHLPHRRTHPLLPHIAPPHPHIAPPVLHIRPRHQHTARLLLHIALTSPNARSSN
mmetsp:Transcript_128385/g.251470  ORF Transcript_128385/g.251470 Transcript_128385/m.251470 type:complete len:266 (+) Transcript_128385:431-1228(+)